MRHSPWRLNVSTVETLEELFNDSSFVNSFSLNENTSNFNQELSIRWPFWQIAFIVGSAMVTGIIITAFIGAVALAYFQRKKRFQPSAGSIYSVPERWDSLSLNYIDNLNDLWKGSMEDLADDAYLACLDKEMARRIACMHAYRNPMVSSCEMKLDRIG